MTVAATDPISTYLGNGTAAPLAVPFRFLENSDLRVTRIDLAGAETVLTLGAHYNVTGAGAPTGGAVTPTATIPVGVRWRIERNTPLTQPTDFHDGYYNADNHELALDRQMLALQEQARDVGDVASRAVLFPRGESGIVLPPERASRFFAFDAAGRPIFLKPTIQIEVGTDGSVRFATVAELLEDLNVVIGYEGSGARFIVQAGDRVTADSYTYEVASVVSVDEHVVTAGGVKLYVLPNQGVYYNIRAFGAVGNNIADDTAIIQKTVNVAAARGGVAFVPVGTFLTTGTILMPTNGNIRGADRNTATIQGAGTFNHTIFTIDGRYVRIEELFIRGGYTGIRHEGWPVKLVDAAQIINNRIQYNRIGILMNNAFICDVNSNYIAFNRVGIISQGGDYQLMIRNNVIDNNIGTAADPGGAGVLLTGPSGASITDNTIEGNRREYTPGGPALGVGLWITGLNQRTLLRGNWMESNGNERGCSDIIVGVPDEPWVAALRDEVIPNPWRGQFVAFSPVQGVMQIDGNHCLATQRGITVSLHSATRATLTITNTKFSGVLGKGCRPVEIYHVPIDSGRRVKVNIHNNAVIGTTAEVNEMMTGVKASYVYRVGDAPMLHGFITLDGEDLFTARLTMQQFLSLPGATLDATSRVPSSGTATLENGAVKSFGGGPGVRTVEDSGRIRAGTAALFATTEAHVLALVAYGANAGITVPTTAPGFARINARGADGRITVNQRADIAAGEGTLHTGDYFGWFVMTKTQFDASDIRGTVRLEITDIQISEAVVVP